MKVWGFYKGTGHLPHRAEMRAALTGWATGTCIWIRRRRRCGSTAPGVELDPGGIGKGYAVDRMVEF